MCQNGRYTEHGIKGRHGFQRPEPAGPYRFVVSPRRTRHIRFNDLADPEPVPRGTDFASVIESDVPIIVRTRGSIPARRRTSS